MSKTLKCSFALLLSSLWGATNVAAQLPADTLSRPKVQGVQYTDRKAAELIRLSSQHRIPLLTGASVSFNLAGALLARTTSSGEYEGAFRLNLRNRYFPIAEIGWGVADAEGATSHLTFSTHAPYFRLGMDYNLKRDRLSKNRIFIGARYGFSAFSYDVSGPDIQDNRWNTTLPFQHSGIDDQVHWGEALFGLEAQLWKFVHVGWSVRYRLRFYEKDTGIGHAWYVPGFGKNTSSAHFGGTFNIVFDLTRFRSQ